MMTAEITEQAQDFLDWRRRQNHSQGARGWQDDCGRGQAKIGEGGQTAAFGGQKHWPGSSRRMVSTMPSPSPRWRSNEIETRSGVR